MAKRKKKFLTKKMKRLIIQLIILFIFMLIAGYFGYDYLNQDNPPDDYDPLPIEGYYEGASGLEGESLRAFLNTLISNDLVGKKYEDAKTALANADVDPNDNTKVLTIYSRASVARVWDSTSWHREHVWPNSRLGIPRVTETQINQASDLHNLRAIVPSINSSRSNKVFGPETTSDQYFPGDADKGDVARILFYMVVRYPFLALSNDVLPNDPETNYTMAGAKMSRFSFLIEWHKQDPVDDFERARNEVIFGLQNNRNPFIDHPEFVAMIFEHESYTPLSYQGQPTIIKIIYIQIHNKERWML